MSSTGQPLAGLRVVEFAEGIAGPYAGKLLADYGADVVKIEPADGDRSRQLGPFPQPPGPDSPAGPGGAGDPEQSGLPALLAPGVADAVDGAVLSRHPELGHFGPLEAPTVIAAEIIEHFGTRP